MEQALANTGWRSRTTAPSPRWNPLRRNSSTSSKRGRWRVAMTWAEMTSQYATSSARGKAGIIARPWENSWRWGLKKLRSHKRESTSSFQTAALATKIKAISLLIYNVNMFYSSFFFHFKLLHSVFSKLFRLNAK